ncbi:hypothetical protein STAQ_09840 [Allostella sp. ATCC 35155]|nr:hypothetical protein STAQ_09840 [Stella sp. ATCC 35155]
MQPVLPACGDGCFAGGGRRRCAGHGFIGSTTLSDARQGVFAVRRGGIYGKVTMQVLVRDNDVNGALRVLKKKMQREGIFREMKMRRAYEKPSERAAREKAEGVRRRRKALRKRMEREGY